MEYLKTIDIVAREELSIVNATRQFSIINNVDIDKKYTKNLPGQIYTYGDEESDSYCKVSKWTTTGAIVTFKVGDMLLTDIKIKLVSEPLIRQLSGAILLAKLLGVSHDAIVQSIQQIEPAASRMMLLPGINESTVIDDTTNFSPLAGIEALKALKRIPGKRHIAILGNMHELGEYADEGFGEVAPNFKTGIDILLLVGDLSVEKFGPYAVKYGFIPDKNLFYFTDSVTAGIYARDKLVKTGDVTLVKGPFGGYYLEEAVKKLLANPADAKKLGRQSNFWINKKSQIFGDSFYK